MLRTVPSLRVGLSWRTFGAIELEYNIKLHSCNVIKAVLFQPVISIKGGDNSHDSFQHQCFQVYFEFMFLLQFYNALIVWKITLFSHDKVVVAQFQARRWFYALIHAKWLPLIWEIKTKQCCLSGNGFISFDKVLLCCLFFNCHAWWPFYTKYIISHYLLY